MDSEINLTCIIGQTIFSRAAKEGDFELVQLLLSEKDVVRDVNRVQSDKTTALIQAVGGNHVSTVEALLKHPMISTSYKSPSGTALQIAEDTNRDPLIIAALGNTDSAISKARRGNSFNSPRNRSDANDPPPPLAHDPVSR